VGAVGAVGAKPSEVREEEERSREVAKKSQSFFYYIKPHMMILV